MTSHYVFGNARILVAEHLIAWMLTENEQYYWQIIGHMIDPRVERCILCTLMTHDMQMDTQKIRLVQ